MAKKKQHKPEIFWAVKSEAHGFYSGTWLTRRGAHFGHFEIAHMDNETGAEFWKRRRKAYGDKIVKIHMIEAR